MKRLSIPIIFILAAAGCSSLPGFSPDDIWNAASTDNVEALQEFVNQGVSVESMDSSGSTPLHAAARAGATGSIAWLCSKGANPNAFNTQGFTPLQVAITSDQRDAVNALLDSGANANIRSQSGKMPLTFAIEFENKEIEADLRARGATQ
jgi:ankyrin repeat protein